MRRLAASISIQIRQVSGMAGRPAEVKAFDMKREQKDYIRPFEVEPTKLTKLLKVMHEKLAGPADHRNRTMSTWSVNHRHSYKRLMRSRARQFCEAPNRKAANSLRMPRPNSASPQSEIDVDFGATFKTGPGSSQTGVSIEVAGESGHGWQIRSQR